MASLTHLLKIYEEASRQRLNNNKTAILVNKNTFQIEKKEIVEVARIRDTQQYDT